MQRIIFTMAPMLALCALTACVEPMYQQQYAVQPPPTMTQTQGQCFSQFKQFAAQTKCINNAVTTSGLAPNSYVQEYLSYMGSLQEKVKRKALSENDARAQLTSKLNDVRTLQQNEDAVQEQLANQRAAQNAEVLRQYQYKAPMLEMPQTRHTLPRTVQTNCSTIGTQVHCTSQ